MQSLCRWSGLAPLIEMLTVSGVMAAGAEEEMDSRQEAGLGGLVLGEEVEMARGTKMV